MTSSQASNAMAVLETLRKEIVDEYLKLDHGAIPFVPSDERRKTISERIAALDLALDAINHAVDQEPTPSESVLVQFPKEYLAHLLEPVPVTSVNKSPFVPSNWTHAICDLCWRQFEGARTPVRYRVPNEIPHDEQCCWCGSPSEGIYYRADPAQLQCKGNHS